MMNVDFEIGDGNPAAAAVRFHVAQHGILSDIDFRIGSGLAGIVEVGNVGQRLRFHGGRYGIIATSTSPFWPYTLIDSAFEGQREAAIREHQTGLTVVRTTFRERAGRDQHRQGVLGSPVAEGRPVRERRHRRRRLRPAAERPHPDRSGGRHLRQHAGLRARARERSYRRHAVGRLPRPAFQPRAVRPRERQHRTDRAGLRRRAAGGGSGGIGAGPARAAADGAVGQRAVARRDGRRQDRRHEGAAGGDRQPARPVLPDRLLRGPRHAGVEAGHRADRAAPRHGPSRPGGPPGRVRRRRRAEGAAPGAVRAAARSSAASASSPARPTRARPPCSGWPGGSRS